MKIGDLVRLKHPTEPTKDLVGILTNIDDWRPVGTVYWNSTVPTEYTEVFHHYLRDIELIKQAKTKAV